MHIKEIERCQKIIKKTFPETTAKVWCLLKHYKNENNELVAEFKHTIKGIAKLKFVLGQWEIQHVFMRSE